MNLQESRSRGDAALPVEHCAPGLGTAQQTMGTNPDRSTNEATIESRSRHPVVHRIAVRIFWPLAAAICAALAVVATGELRYHATARFRIHGSLDVGRRELLDFLWLHAGQDHLADWNVQIIPDSESHSERGEESSRKGIPARVLAASELTGAPAERMIQADISVTDPDRAGVLIQSLAAGFKEHVAKDAPLRTRESDDTEQILTAMIDQSRGRIEGLCREMDRLESVISAGDPARDVAEAETRIAERVAEYQSLRSAETDAMARVDHLATTPIEPRVDLETRQTSYQARSDLQQDLDELTVQLTLGRRHLDDVWQKASPALDELISSVARQVRLGSSDAARTADGTHRSIVTDLTHRAELYQKRLNTFSNKWIETFVRLRSQPVDPRAPHLFAAQLSLHKLLADFSFHAGKLVDDMRGQIQSLTQQTNDADHHALVSQMRRAFHRVEADHRQFELLAADVYLRNNFRLDAAVRSARGLRHRVRTTVDTIDAKLLADATARASRVQQMRKREADRELRKTRERCHDTIDTLLRILPVRDQALQRSEARTRSADVLEGMKQRLAAARKELQEREALLNDHLRAVRAARTPPLSIDIIECGADDTPQGLARKLSYAAVAAVLAFTTVTFVNRR